MNPKTIILYGARQPWDRQRELLLGRPITYGIVQMAMTPFATSWTAVGDIVAIDERRCVTGVIVRNSRTHYGRFDVYGFDELQVARRAECLGRYLLSHLMDCTFVSRFPGAFAMSVDLRVPLEHVMDLADQSPVRFQVLGQREFQIT